MEKACTLTLNLSFLIGLWRWSIIHFITIQFSKTQADGKTVTYTNPIAINIGYDYRYAYGNMFYAQIVKQYITSISNNNSQGNSAIVKAALKELNEGIHKGGTKYWQWYGFNGRV